MGGDALLPALGCHGRQPPFKNFNHRNVQFRFFTLHFSETYNTFLQFESLLTTILLLHLPFPRNLYHPCSRVLDPKPRMAGDNSSTLHIHLSLKAKVVSLNLCGPFT